MRVNRIICPACKATLTSKTGVEAGTSIACPKCKQKFAVAAPVDEIADDFELIDEEDETPKRKPIARKPVDDEEEERPRKKPDPPKRAEADDDDDEKKPTKSGQRGRFAERDAPKKPIVGKHDNEEENARPITKKRRPADDDEDRPRARKRSHNDEEDEDRPLRRKKRHRDDDEDLGAYAKLKGNIWVRVGVLTVLLSILGVGIYLLIQKNKKENSVTPEVAANDENPDKQTRPKNAGSKSKKASKSEPEQSADDDDTNRSVRRVSVNNLKQLALGAMSFHDVVGMLPFPGVSASGKKVNLKPHLSWRVAILPYINEQKLYEKFHLDEPWDSEHNKKFLDQMPRTFAPPGANAPAGHTFYQAFTGPNTISAAPLTLAGIPDGTSNTIMIVEAGEAVPWTKPDELSYDPNGPLPKLGGIYGGNFHAALADGSVRYIRKDIPEKVLRAIITANGGETVDWNLVK
jgi:Protein of unknown function (DUF1559)